MNTTVTKLLRIFPLTRKLTNRATRLSRQYPRVINIELTTKCNSRCNYCGREKLIADKMRSVKDMDFGLFKQIIDQIKEIPEIPERIVPVGLGDPMLYPQFPRALAYLRSVLPDHFVQMTTNGIYFPASHQEALISHGINKLVISINFFSKEMYARHNGIDKLDQVVANAIQFLKIKGRRSPAVTLQILDIEDNRKDIQSFKTFWQTHLNAADRILVRPFNDFGGTIDAGRFITLKKQKFRYPCPQIFDHLMINVDGYCFPCCMGITATNDDSLCIGNIKSQTIQGFFREGARVHQIREMHKTDVYDRLPKCRSCDTWSYGDNMFFRKAGRWR
jgi:MoaA/NifB/PqqE/SkfB family radical SAM enzyme